MAKKKLRKYRNGLDMSRAVITGPESCRAIVYGYGFPSKPGRMKIGFSSRGLERVMEQSTGFPEKPVVFFCIRHPRAKELEASFHAALAHRQSDTVGVEWFDVSFEEVVDVSPHLRKAIGMWGKFTGLRLLGSLLGAAAGILVFPAVYILAVSIFDGPEALIGGARALEVTGQYFSAMIGGNAGEVVAGLRSTFTAALNNTFPVSAAICAMVPVAAGIVLPMAMGRRQARAP